MHIRAYSRPLSIVIEGAVTGLAGNAAFTAVKWRSPLLLEENPGISLEDSDLGVVPAGPITELAGGVVGAAAFLRAMPV